MMKLTPLDVQNLVCKAFCLEAIADKKDCTSRYVDLENRPLEGFVLSGINSASVFADFATDWRGEKKEIFHLFDKALSVSNQHKSNKFVNFGLLEIMFPTVAARLSCDNPELSSRKSWRLCEQAPKST